TARIGYVGDRSFRNTYDTFRTCLITMYGTDTFAFPCTGAEGLWFRILVIKLSFRYYPLRSMCVFEIVWRPQPAISLVRFPHIINSKPPKGNHLLLIFAYKQSNKVGSIIQAGMDLGFDLGQPAGVEAFSNISSAGLFPNPCTDGRFNISLDAQRPIK